MTKSELINNLPECIDNTWLDFIHSEISKISEIEKIILQEKNYTPPLEKVLRFLNVPLNKVKIIILGQDPYPQEGVATGRAFEVGTLKEWNEKFRNISLKNIIRAIYKAYSNEILGYKDIFKKEFKILPPCEIFEYWESQGVLLLNTAFTCEIGKSNSHSKIWNDFTNSLLEYIAEKNQKAYWFLWGDNAKKVTVNIKIDKARKIVTFHPMMCYNRENDFLYGNTNPFKITKNIIDWTGYKNGL
ncbi:MAG: uracil-DNA glycosylase [Bacteroidales bacterium]|nr:uracil-DNA glycosylase [Bacteroidales bacterium]